jgi:hypothetical protein
MAWQARIGRLSAGGRTGDDGDDRRAEHGPPRDTRLTADDDTRRTIYDSAPLRLADAPAEQGGLNP